MTFAFRGPLLRLVGYQREIDVDGTTVEDSLEALCRSYPDLRSVLFDAAGRLRPVHRLALNHSVLARTELGTAVSAGDRVDVITAIAGG